MSHLLARLGWAGRHTRQVTAGRPLFSLLIRGGGETETAATVRSLLAQRLAGWEAFLIQDDGSAADRPPLPGDDRISPLPVKHGTGLIAALDVARGTWLVDLAAGSVLAEDALSVLARVLDLRPDVLAFYADTALTGPAGHVTGFQLKPAWNPDLFDAIPYAEGLVGVRLSFLATFREGTRPDVQPWYFPCLREAGRVRGAVRHVAEVLLTRPQALSEPWPGLESRMAYLRSVLPPECGVLREQDAPPGAIRVVHPVPHPPPEAEIIIPTRNGGDMLRRCLESVFAKTDYPHYLVTLVDNGSDDPLTLDLLARLSLSPGVRLVRDEQPFNFAAINNRAVSASGARVVCLLNDDVEVISPGWLTELVSQALRPEVGAVGARLLYPDGRIQHGGVVLGLRRSAAHAHKGFPGKAPGYMGRLRLVQDCTAVTAACLAVDRKKYLGVGGMDEQSLAVAYNDVDLCLKLRRAGYLNVWTPHAELYHHESATRGRDVSPEKRLRLKAEAAVMNERWGMREYQDPYYHPALSRKCEDFSLAGKPWPLGRRRRPQCR